MSNLNEYIDRATEILGHIFTKKYKLEREFWFSVLVGEQIRKNEPNNEHNQTYRFVNTREKYYDDKDFCCDKCGVDESCPNRKPYADRVKKTMLDVALKPEFTRGFDILKRNDCLYLSFEAVVIRNPSHFDKKDIEQVKEKMCAEGYPPDFWRLPPSISY